MVTKHGLLKCRSVRRKPPVEQRSRRETVEARGTKWNLDVAMDFGISGPPVASRPDEGMSTATTQGEIPRVPPPAPPPEEHVPEMRGQGVHAKALRIRPFQSKIGRTPGSRACETPGTRAAEPHQRRKRNVELLEIQTHDRMDPSGSSLDPEPKRTKTTSVTDNENLADRMDEDNFRRGPATSHQLEPVDDENMSKKARVARN